MPIDDERIEHEASENATPAGEGCINPERGFDWVYSSPGANA
jgi:hypothetical protein